MVLVNLLISVLSVISTSYLATADESLPKQNSLLDFFNTIPLLNTFNNPNALQNAFSFLQPQQQPLQPIQVGSVVI
jgi:hypothetical protein